MASPQKPRIRWKIAAFDKLTGIEVHDMLRLREDIFVVEQACAYHEIDGVDPDCYHIMGFLPEGRMVATSRIAPAELIYPECSIGRVVVHSDCRKWGLGRDMMERTIRFCSEELKVSTIKIAAQKYLEDFYASLDFVTISDSYLWDGIPHVDMRLSF